MVLIPIYVAVYLLIKNPLYTKGYLYKEAQNAFFSSLNEQLSNVKLLKINCWFDQLTIKLKKSFNNLYINAMKYAKISFILNNLDLTINRMATVIIFYYGGRGVLDGTLTVGNLIAITSYFSILLGTMSYFLNFGKLYQDARVSYSRLLEIINLNEELNGTKTLSQIDSIRLEKVSFSFKEKTILNNYSKTLLRGKIYCIRGFNGKGKTTFLDLCLGIIKNYEGEIYYNSTDISDLDMYKTRSKLIGVCEQEPCLIDDTIRNNIVYGLDEITEKEIFRWCGELGFTIIEKLDMKVNSRIISGGEKQKIALLRTFLKNPDVLILDEPGSALDDDSIDRLKKSLKNIKDTKLIIIVTHDEGLCELADEIIEF